MSMAPKPVNVLILGDVCGQPGLRALFVSLGTLKKETHADFTIINGENAADGFGLSVPQMNELFTLGADVITSGNHIWQQEDLRPVLDSEPRLLRPANYPSGVPGHGMTIRPVGQYKIAVINLQGRNQMPRTDDPFAVGKAIVQKARKETPMIIVDFHAEETAEKEALGFYLDGKVSVVAGTHTHVATLDAKILPGGTAYQTDIGFCGPKGSVIGSDPEVAIRKQLTQMPLRNPILDAPAEINGILASLDPQTGKALSVTRIRR